MRQNTGGQEGGVYLLLAVFDRIFETVEANRKIAVILFKLK